MNIFGGEEPEFPHDPDGSAEQVINCRCVVVGVLRKDKAVDNLREDGIIDYIKTRFELEKSRDRPFDISNALKATNPEHKINIGYDKNCQRCVAAYELRRRGYDVKALPRIDNDNINSSADMFKKTNKYVKDKETLMNELINYPDGTRFSVRQEWLKGGAHAYVAEKIDGEIIFMDPQIANFDASFYLDMAKSGTIGYFRMDNAKIKTSVILKAVEVVK